VTEPHAQTAVDWSPLATDQDAADGTLRRVAVGATAVCLGRVDGEWVAFDDTCTHEECSLADGELDGDVIVCPCHGSEFDVRTGEVLSPPALDPLPVYPIRVQDGTVYVRPATLPAPDEARTRTPARPSGRPAGVRLEDVDLTDLDRWVEGVPQDWFTLLRREHPVFWQDEPAGRGFWSITRYEDVVAVSRDFATFSSELGGTSLDDLEPDEVEARKSMIDTDPPRHTRLRAIVNKGFTPRVINAYEDRIRGLAREILERALQKDELDFVADVAAELPMWVFSELMGLPLEDRRTLIETGDKLLGNADPELVGEEAIAEKARYRHLPFSSPYAAEMFDYAHRLAAQRRSEPRDDITTKLLEAEVDGDRLSEREFDVFFLLLTLAGNETTRHSISHGLLALLEHPQERERLAADPSLTATGADEVLRWATAVHHFRRTATRDVELHGEVIRAGDKVLVWYTSGNRDEQQFPEPDRFDVGRTPNRHLTFGLGGPHFCLGAHLARLEVKIWLDEMIAYLDRLELAGPPVRLRSNFFNGIKRLPVKVRG
jgi:cytochrome P450/nitrite reductase/ring-hydroxylating ferredoxin subunit